MTLSFTQKIDGKPNYFVQKIWNGFPVTEWIELPEDYRSDYYSATGNTIDIPDPWDEIKPKIHTIREDKHNRWRAGMDIHFVINNRTPNRFQFAPVIPCVSVQEIEITPEGVVNPFNWNEVQQPKVTIDGKILSEGELTLLSNNDGFENKEDFFRYFKGGFVGKIIHWTNFKY